MTTLKALLYYLFVEQRANSIARTWAKIDLILTDAKGDRLKLGEHFLQLQLLYSNKSADIRRLGIGTFEQELAKRGLKPRTVRERISDFKAHQSGEPSSAAKRKALRQRDPNKPSAEFNRGYKTGHKDGYSAGYNAAIQEMNHRNVDMNTSVARLQ